MSEIERLYKILRDSGINRTMFYEPTYDTTLPDREEILIRTPGGMRYYAYGVDKPDERLLLRRIEKPFAFACGVPIDCAYGITADEAMQIIVGSEKEGNE